MSIQEVINGETCMINAQTDVRLVDQIVARVCSFVSGFGIRPNPDIKIVLRELLMNAMVHGNNQDPAKRVILRVTHFGRARFKIEVEDEGNGFNYLAIQTFTPILADIKRQKHGLQLVANLSEGLFFNHSGNVATAFVSVPSAWGGEVDKSNQKGIRYA